MAVILEYQPGRAIPHIAMNIIRKEGMVMDNNNYYVQVGLRGIPGREMLHLVCTHFNTAAG